MPQVVIKAQKAMTNPQTGGKELAKILQTDPAIVTSMLKIANSAYYGLSGKVSSIEPEMSTARANESGRSAVVPKPSAVTSTSSS